MFLLIAMQWNLCLLKFVTEKLETRYFNLTYWSPNTDTKISEQFCKDLFHKNSENLKNIILAGKININVLDYKQNKKVRSVF